MSLVRYTVSVRNSQAGGKRVTGLKPEWVLWKDSVTLDTPKSPPLQPVEVGGGIYQLCHDPDLNGEVVGQLDFGEALAAESDRFVDVTFTKDTSGNMEATLTGSSLNALVKLVAASTAAGTPLGGLVDSLSQLGVPLDRLADAIRRRSQTPEGG